MGVVRALGKGLCSKRPLLCALMSICLTSLDLECGVQAWHVAGERSQDADKLSRRNCLGFKIKDEHFCACPPELQVVISVNCLLHGNPFASDACPRVRVGSETLGW